jgi:transketolase
MKMEKKVVELSKEVEDVEERKKNDATLNDLKEDLKALAGGYNDLKKEAKKKIQYLLLLLESRGKL